MTKIMSVEELAHRVFHTGVLGYESIVKKFDGMEPSEENKYNMKKEVWDFVKYYADNVPMLTKYDDIVYEAPEWTTENTEKMDAKIGEVVKNTFYKNYNFNVINVIDEVLNQMF